MSKVTFLMMAYNTEAYVEKAVRSVLNQTEKDINIIVRDNGSTDRTGEILEKIATEDNRVILLKNKINGKTQEGVVPFNRGWWFTEETCLGEFVSIIDSDDWIDEHFVEKLYREAKKNNADITFTGNWFISNGKAYSKRIPPVIEEGSPKNMKNCFEAVHECFRTWWGKLFEKSFFIKNYEECWEPVQPLWWCMDTITMMKYLKSAKKVISVCEPLYYMLVRNTSTYNTRRADVGRILEAYTMYMSMHQVLSAFDMETSENLSYLKKVHWGYLKEVLDTIPYQKELSCEERYNWIENVIMDDICASYNHTNFSIIFFQVKPVLEKLESQYDESTNIFKSYLARLNAFVNLASDDDTLPTLYVILMGVLCDTKNRTRFGTEFLDLPIKTKSPGIEKANTFHDQIRKWWSVYPNDWIKCINDIDSTEKVKELEKNLYRLAETDSEAAIDTAIELLIKSPVNPVAIIYISNAYRKNGSIAYANLLDETIKVLWKEEMSEIKRKLNLR